MKSDVEAFYPSISQELLKKAITYARTITIITEKEEYIIYHCRKNILVGQSRSTWQKVENPDFNVTIGCIDGAEIAENVG